MKIITNIIVTRTQAAATNSIYRHMFKTERHHKHLIINDSIMGLRWLPNPAVNEILRRISLNDLCSLLTHLGYDKNSEIYRKLFRDMGYSLFGYWEIFYWDVNNPESHNYKPHLCK